MFVPVTDNVIHFSVDDSIAIQTVVPPSCNAVSIITKADNTGDFLISFEDAPVEGLCLTLYPGTTWSSNMAYKKVKHIWYKASTGGLAVGQIVFGTSD
jgi:hypothetical protein